MKSYVRVVNNNCLANNVCILRKSYNIVKSSMRFFLCPDQYTRDVGYQHWESS